MQKEEIKKHRKELEIFLNAELRIDKEMIKESIVNYMIEEVSYLNKVCLDLGSNLGAFSKIAIDGGASKVIAVECDPRNYNKANHNFRDINNVELIHAAVSGSKEKTLQIFKSNSQSNHASTSIIKKTSTFNEYMIVNNINFTEIVNRINPDIIKIDIEGAEHDIIDDIINFLPDVLFLELHGGYHKCELHLEKLRQAYPNCIINEIIYFNSTCGYDCVYYK